VRHGVELRNALAAAMIMAASCGLRGADVAGPTLTSDAPAAPDLALEQAVDEALRANAQLRAMRSKWEAMQERPAQTRALPNPVLKYSGMDMADGGTWPDTNEKRLMVEQEFPWLGKRGLREGIAAKEAEAMLRELQSMTREVVMMVKETYYQLYALHQAIRTTRKDEEVLQRMANIAETMYSTGERTQQDVLKAKAESTMLKQRLLELDAQETTLKAKLNTFLNRRADTPIGGTVTPPEPGEPDDAEKLFALAATNRPEVRAAQAQIERYDLEKKLMAKEGLPDYSLGVEYRSIGNGDDMVMFTAGIDLPVRRAKYRAGVREAEKMKASSESAREAAVQQSSLDVQDASFRLRTARRTLELYRHELIPQAEARFKASEADYQTGKVDFMDLLESQRFLLSARVMAAMAEGDVGMQFARLERAVGTDLPFNVNAGERGK